jgi:hypothetical protein
MSRQLALSAILSVLAMLAVAACAPEIADVAQTYPAARLPALALR